MNSYNRIICNRGTQFQECAAWGVECRSVSYEEKGKLGILNTWINYNGVANILYISELYSYEYRVTYDTKVKLKGNTPEGYAVNFKRNYGKCKGVHTLT